MSDAKIESATDEEIDEIERLATQDLGFGSWHTEVILRIIKRLRDAEEELADINERALDNPDW